MAWLYNSRVISIYAVVFLHVAANAVLHNDVGSEYWWYGNIYDSLVRWCVPVFVMISGALLLDPDKKESLTCFYKKRVGRILLPLLFWSAFFTGWVFLIDFLKGEELNYLKAIKDLFSGTPYYHLWFLYMITGLYLFTPFFRKLTALLKEKELIFLIYLLFIFSAAFPLYQEALSITSEGEQKNSPLFIHLFLPYIAYFFLGHFIRQNNKTPPLFLLLCVFILPFIGTVLGCYFTSIHHGLDVGLYFYHYLSITVIPMSISVMYLLKRCQKPLYSLPFTKKMASLTLGIYLIHPVILDVINYTNIISFSPLISIPLVTAIVFITALTGAWIIDKIPYLKRVI